MSLKKQRNNLQTTIFETLQTIMMLQDDESVVSSLMQAAAFEQTNNAFRQHFQTGNLCSEDVSLPLKRLDASAEYTVVWLHCGAKLDDDTEQDAITKLHCVFNHVEMFDSLEKCIHFLRELDANTTRLFLITSCFYDGMALGTKSPLADRDSELTNVLRHFKFEYHIHGHASQWSSPNYVHTLSELFSEAKFDHDAIKLLYDEPFRPPYQLLWLRSIQNTQLEQHLRSVFDSLKIYDDRQLCFEYLSTVDRNKLLIYFIVDDRNSVLEWKETVHSVYEVASDVKNIDRIVLQIRNDVRNESNNPFHCIERSVRRLNNKYAPFVSLMAHLDLYVALSRNVRDRQKMKEDMLAVCRLAYHDNALELKKIDRFETEYDPTIKGHAIRWYTRDSFIFRLINRALRTGNADFIYPYRFFINDLYSELLSMDRHDCEEYDDLIVYRGQCITTAELEYLQNYIGQLLTLSSFTSTTIDREVALIFIKTRENMVPILFEIHLNTNLDNTRPFAYIASYSVMPDELEVLIAVGTIFQLISVAYNRESDAWVIVVQLCQQHSYDIKNFIHDKSTPSGNFQPMLFRSSSVPVVSKFDANLEKFNSKRSFYHANIEKTVSLPMLTKDDTQNTITRTYSLRSNHNYPSDIIKCNMQFFQRKARQRTHHIAFSCPSFPTLTSQSLRRRHSFANLPTISNKRSRFHIFPQFLLDEPEDTVHVANDDYDDQHGLFTAGIHDTIMIFNLLAVQESTKSVSLKEQADELRHDLRKIFNLEKGRWCAEF